MKKSNILLSTLLASLLVLAGCVHPNPSTGNQESTPSTGNQEVSTGGQESTGGKESTGGEESKPSEEQATT